MFTLKLPTKILSFFLGHSCLKLGSGVWIWARTIKKKKKKKIDKEEENDDDNGGKHG